MKYLISVLIMALVIGFVIHRKHASRMRSIEAAMDEAEIAPIAPAQKESSSDDKPAINDKGLSKVADVADPSRNKSITPAGDIHSAALSESTARAVASAPLKDEKPKLELSNTESKFKWDSRPIDKNKFAESLSHMNKTPEQIAQMLASMPDSYKVVQASPGEVKLDYSQVQIVSCPPVPALPLSMVVRFDTGGIPVDVEWETPLKNKPIPTFVTGCKFAPALVDGVPTPAVFIWPSDAVQAFAHKPHQF
jgi:hypothetical protein